jgi:hypothetical protein
METLTIDAKEIIDWLRQRRKVNDQWVQKHKSLKAKLKEVTSNIASIGLTETKDFFKNHSEESESDINYLDLLQLNELILKSKEAEGRTIFGGYSSKAIKELQALLKVFEKENISVASLAAELSQILSFEIPSAKKVIKSNEAQIGDLHFKISTYSSSVGNAKSSIAALVQKYNKNFDVSEENIEQLDVESFLNHFVLLLPLKIKVFLNDFAKVDIPKMIEYYVRFAKLNNFSEIDRKDFEILEWLYIHGDCLVSDFQSRTSPDPYQKDQLYEALLRTNGFKQDSLNPCGAIDLGKLIRSVIR